ncbi:hypothetical protein PH562_18760 [Rhizobium sp. CNPSo 4062]|uniref:hypothetical protein n=1 Tax=Rhizobium sp. CNPSo 4062 TaxID=3021410 RepID=UPI00254E0C89|nr:hypothetical protein [Rhizobium sp. CNPSo 4062]MDK4704301.1 hypothetical protein [Rhizobium sp. CNPSo 4062]
MAIFTRTINVSAHELGAIADKLEELGVDLLTLPVVEVEAEIDVCVDDFGYDEIYQAYNDAAGVNGNWLERAYRFLAEGDVASAMEEMHHNITGLAPPSHERAIADLLGGRRAHG